VVLASELTVCTGDIAWCLRANWLFVQGTLRGACGRTERQTAETETVCFACQRDFWCRIHLWFRLIGGLQAKSMTSQRYRAAHKMADMRYCGNVMTTTRWWLYVTMETLWQQQDGGYALIFYIFNSTVIDWTCYMFCLYLCT